MKTEKIKILLIVPPARHDFYNYLEQTPNADFYILFFVTEKESQGVQLPSFIKGQYYWSDYQTPKDLLEKINPLKIVFFEILDQRQISLIVAANYYSYTTFYLEHGAAGDKETARQRSEVGKLKHVFFNRIPNVANKLTISFSDAFLVKKFYFSNLHLLKGVSKKKYAKLPLLMLSKKPNKALMLCIFPERIPQKCILFNHTNFEEFQLYTGVNEERVTMDGVPFFDKYYTDQNDISGPIVYIEQPLLEEEVCGWTPNHHQKIAFALKNFAEQLKEKIIVKLHPRSRKQIWDSYSLKSEYIDIVTNGDYTDMYLKSKLILGYASSLINGFVCAKKNVVLLGWHPEPHVFGADFSKYSLCHLSLNINDLKLKFEYWINNNQAEINENRHEAFLREFNYPFDGKATERVIKTITEYDVH